MRIGLIAPPWIPVPPPLYGGTEGVIANLARGLTDRGHEVSLFSLGASTCPVQCGHLFTDPVEPMGQGALEAAHVLAAYEALGDMDIVHDHTVLGPLIAGRADLRAPPVVTTNHGLFTEVTRRILREVARTASVVAISHDQARRASGVSVAAVIHHGIDLDTYRPGPGGGDHLVFIGRMSPDKGVDRAIRIARSAGRPLRIISKMHTPEERHYFESRIRPLLGAGVGHPEELPLADRLQVLGTAVALVNPISWPEPFGLVMVESLATGTPVITAPRGAAPEIVTDGRTGFLCETEAQAVESVHRLAEIDRADCRSEAEGRFSLHRMAADYEGLFERLLDAPSLPRQLDVVDVASLSGAAGVLSPGTDR